MTFPALDEVEHILDAAVEDVFVQMLATPCSQVPAPVARHSLSGTITAVLGFAGVLTGLCIITAKQDAVMEISARLTGVEVHEIDETALDAIGELSNMICGGWKNRIPGMDSGCALAIPTVIQGHQYQIYTAEHPLFFERTYRFGSKHLYIAIHCDLSQMNH